MLLPLRLSHAEDEPSLSREFKIKVAFVYNFIKFVDWPGHEDKKNRINPPNFTIAVIGHHPSLAAFDSLSNKTIKGRKVVIKKFKGYGTLLKENGGSELRVEKSLESLKSCQLLFVCSSEKKYLEKILAIVEKHAVLSVSDADGFLSQGGVIRLLATKDNKLGFEINYTVAKKCGLKISSRLLKLAVRTL